MKVVQLLTLDAVLPGMKVAEALLDKVGNVLLPVGAEITPSMLLGLARRDVQGVKVELEVVEDPEQTKARSAEIVADLDRIFRKAGDATETRTLYQTVLDYRLESCQ